MAHPEFKFLVNFLAAELIRILPKRVEAICNFPPPKNMEAVGRFHGMVGYYGNFLKGFSRMVEPLLTLKRNGATFMWGEPQRKAFEELVTAISTPTELQVPNFSKELVLVCG
jgi:hypothetical protein